MFLCMQKTLKNYLIRWPILYFVNRRILKKQIVEELQTTIQPILFNRYHTSVAIENYIKVVTYQSVEEALKGNRRQELEFKCSQFGYAVYDECHYFLSDSTFNPATILSLSFLENVFDNKVQIFMSATVDDIKKHCIDNLCSRSPDVKPRMVPRSLKQLYYRKGRLLEYPEKPLKKEYDNIVLHGFRKIEDLASIIIGSQDKWLIFVDSKNDGRKLLWKLYGKGIPKEAVSFIDADYEEYEETQKDVDEIVWKKASSKKVLICTAVLDNGISIWDKTLRNIVILTDLEEEFIQMLGRKRLANIERVDLYICIRDKRYFGFRLAEAKETLRYRSRYQKIIESAVCNSNTFLRVGRLNLGYQQIILNDIFQDEKLLNQLRKFCFIHNGVLSVSQLSLLKLSSMEMFYEEMIRRLDSDDLAFLKMQAQWIGRNEDDVEMFAEDFAEEQRQNDLAVICSAIDERIGKNLSKEENMVLRSEIKLPIQSILRTLDKKNYAKEISSLYDGTISEKSFNGIMKALGLPYQMTRISGRPATYSILSTAE